MGKQFSYAALLEQVRLQDAALYREVAARIIKKGADLPKVSDNPGRQAHYAAMRLDGTGHHLAEMLALQRPPMSNTDREFLEGHCNGNQFEGQEWVGEMYRRDALEAGVDPKGKVYLAGLARFPGDPEAWVGGRGDVQRVCEQRGWGAEGSVSIAPRQAEPKQTKVAADLVDGEVNRILQSVPAEERAYVDTEDLREQVTERRQPHWA